MSVLFRLSKLDAWRNSIVYSSSVSCLTISVLFVAMSAEALLEHFCSSHGVSFHLKKSDFVHRVCEKNISTEDLSSARMSIFSTAQSMGLADKRADIVSRRGTSLNPLKEKLAGDVWDLAQSVSSKTRVKRVLFKNGKRRKSFIENKLEMKDTKGAGTIAMLCLVNNLLNTKTIVLVLRMINHLLNTMTLC